MRSVARTQFEELIAWQKARALANEVRRVTAQPRFREDRDLVWQARRAAVSVMANVAEGWDRSTRRDTLHFLAIAKASCAEVRSHLYVMRDADLIDDVSFQRLSDAAAEVSRIIAGLRRSLSARR